jgi:small-conductance mechanosensitive channel
MLLGHFAAVGRAAALALAGVLGLAAVVARLAPALALAGVLALTGVLFFYFLVGLRVVLRGRRSVRAGCEIRSLYRRASSREQARDRCASE